MFPTLMAMAGLDMPKTRPLDGKNVWPALRDHGSSPVESYYWSWHTAGLPGTHRQDRIEFQSGGA
jgi:hypothetical protein